MAGHEAARRAAEATIGHERDRIAQPCADDGRGDAEHLAHARSAARPFVADDDHVAGDDLACELTAAKAVFFAVEDPRRPRCSGARSRRP